MLLRRLTLCMLLRSSLSTNARCLVHITSPFPSRPRLHSHRDSKPKRRGRNVSNSSNCFHLSMTVGGIAGRAALYVWLLNCNIIKFPLCICSPSHSKIYSRPQNQLLPEHTTTPATSAVACAQHESKFTERNICLNYSPFRGSILPRPPGAFRRRLRCE